MEGQAQFFYQSAAGAQRTRAHIGSHHTGRNPLLHQIGTHIAVVTANIRHRAAGRHCIYAMHSASLLHRLTPRCGAAQAVHTHL